jgi:hypothetical protein
MQTQAYCCESGSAPECVAADGLQGRTYKPEHLAADVPGDQADHLRHVRVRHAPCVRLALTKAPQPRHAMGAAEERHQ